MKKYKYVISNVDCATCAKKLEKNISKIRGFNSVIYNFATTKLYFETDRSDFEQELKNVVHASEPGAVLSSEKEVSAYHKTFWQEVKLDVILLGLGVLIGGFSLFTFLPEVASWILLIVGAALMLYKTAAKAAVQLFRGFNIGENLLITISVIGAIAVGEHMEGLMVIGLYSIGKILESRALNNSRKSVAELMQIQPEFAVVKNGEKEEKKDPHDVAIGSIIVVRPGERVPLDGKVISGNASINTSHLTGESVPQLITVNDKVISGSIVLDGALEIVSESSYRESTVSRIMDLIEHATDKKSKTETFITKFARWYTLGVLGLSVMVFLFSFFVFHDAARESIYRSLIFLVISCPCAFAISVPLSYFSAIGKASKRGILIKGSNYLDVAANLDTIIFDKTGTLTTGVFGVSEIISLDKKYSEKDILTFAALGEQYSIHPIAKAIMAEAADIKLKKITNFKEKPGKGVGYTFNDKEFFVGGGDSSAEKQTAVFINQGDKTIGKILLSDRIKESSKLTISGLKEKNIKVTMLSGDNAYVTTKVASELGIESFEHSMLPAAKFEYLEKKLGLKQKGQNIAFAGDGINDAPSLSRADLGISMGIAGSPATIEASDVVLIDDRPEKVLDLIKLSKYSRIIVLQNIIFALVTKILILVLGTLDIVGMLAAVFADVGVTLLAILNSLRILRYNFGQKKNEVKACLHENLSDHCHGLNSENNICSCQNDSENHECKCKTGESDDCHFKKQNKANKIYK